MNINIRMLNISVDTPLILPPQGACQKPPHTAAYKHLNNYRVTDRLTPRPLNIYKISWRVDAL